MLKRISVLAGLALFLVVGGAEAQDPDRRLGFGVSLLSGGVLGSLVEPSFGLPIIQAAIIVSPNVKLEPEIGLLRFSESSESEFSQQEETFTQWRFGLGIHYMFPPSEAMRAYIGPRLGLILVSESEESDGVEDESDETHFSFGAVFGGEYFFSDAFSLGGELQINYFIFGEPDDLPEGVELDSNAIANAGKVIVRWYP